MTRLLLALALLHVSVAQEPHLVLLPDRILKPLNDGVYVSCAAVVENPDLVTEMRWSGPDAKEIPNEDGTRSKRISALEDIGGPGKLDLVIQKLREEDKGVYECIAIYAGNQKLSKNLTVDYYMDIDFGDTPVHQSPIIYTESKIRCNPTAKPAPQVDWLKDGMPLRNGENHIIQQDGVLIKNVTEADEGVYRCRARVPELGSINYRDIQVEVLIPPTINIPPTDVKGVEQDSATFECGALGKPAPTYSWVDHENRPLQDLEGYFVDAEKGTLSIMDLKPEHTGTYRCTASNQAGDDTAEVKLQVLTKPKVEQYLNLTVAVDTTTEMNCVATGDPLPEIVFKKESNGAPFQNGINSDDRIEIQQTTDDQGRRVGILKIRGVMRADDGLYTCTAESEGGVTQVWGHITVEFPPSFEQQVDTEKWSWQQRSVNLTCLATSIPNATIQWYLRNEEIQANDPNLEVLELGPLGVLRVNPVTNSYYGDYTCQATNLLGSETWDIKLKEAHVPGPVPSATVEKKTATTITWKILEPADDGGLPILGFLVEYRLQDMVWGENTQSHFWTKDQAYTLDELQPQAIYVFRFAARSEAGDGEFGGEKVEEMPHRAAPEEPHIFDVDDGVTGIPYPNEFTLRWNPPLDNGETIDFYQIIYYQVHNKSGQWEDMSDKTTESVEYPTTVYKIENLHSNSHYKIELRAHNLIGFSTPAEAIIKTAEDPTAPTGPELPQPSKSAPGVGLIVGIVVIALIILAVLLDVTCYCKRNAGLTATVLGKRGDKDKDKEAMLEDGKNASADTLNEESKDEIKCIDEKPEKEVPQTPEKKAEIISEKPTEEKHEGNGEMKQQKEEEPEKESLEAEEKGKEAPEPTETTPMIQGEKDDKKEILKEEQKEEEEKLKKSESTSSVTKDSPV